MNNRNKIAVFCLLLIFSISSIAAIAPVNSQGNNTYTAYGPIGTGPYIYAGYDPTTATNKLVKNDNYWNKAALEANGQFGITEFYVQNIQGTDAAISSLKSGDVDVLDSQYGIGSQISSIQSPWGDYISYDAFGVQEMGFNLQHPVFGTGVETPLGKANASRAAEGARYVRQAISHLIPRQQIIDTILNGYGSPGVTTPITKVTAGYNTSLTPYDYNVTLAKELLTDAGYDTTSGATLFNMTLLVPTPNPSRQAWSEIIQNSLKNVSIACDRVILDWDLIYGRALTPDPSVVGKTYANGGFDALFVGYAVAIDPNPYAFYDSTQFAPTGQNYNLWNNTENDNLGRLIKETVNETQRLEYVNQWEQLAYDEVPACTILYTKEIVAFNPTELLGAPFTVYHYPVWPGVEKWMLNASSPKTKIVIAQTGACPVEGLNPWLTTSYYDLTAWGPVFNGLADRNDTDTKQMLPDLATSWSVAADGMTWTVNLRQGVTWHDGVKFNATDVKFTYASAMNETLASPVGSFLVGVLGSPDNIEIVDEYTVVFHLPAPYAYFVQDILARTGYGMMLPAHVLQSISLADWKTSPYNTAANSYTVTLPVEATPSPSASPSVTPSPSATAGPAFLDQYGVYIAVIVVVIIVIIVAVAMLMRRGKKPAAAPANT